MKNQYLSSWIQGLGLGLLIGSASSLLYRETGSNLETLIKILGVFGGILALAGSLGILKETNKEFKRFEIAPQDKVDLHPRGLEIVLEAVGHPEAMVTDDSKVSDFCCSLGKWSCEGIPVEFTEEEKQEDLQTLQKLSKVVNRVVTTDDYIWQLAKEAEA